MKEKKIIEIKQEVTNYIQRLFFEVEARKDVIATLLDSHKADENIDLLVSPVFLEYSKQLTQAKAEYEIAKGELDAFIPKEILKNRKFDWNLNFASSQLELTVY